MKRYAWLIATALQLITICQSNAGGTLTPIPTWKENGEITQPNGEKIQLDIQSIYNGFNYAGSQYVIGFKMDEEQNNHPYIVRINNDSSSITYWPFNKIPNDIFLQKDTINTITTDGKVYALKNEQWILTEHRYPSDSHVIYSDNAEKTILCYPSSMEKNAMHNGGCLLSTGAWQQDFLWFSVTPKVCKGELYVIEDRSNLSKWNRIDLTTGKILGTIGIDHIPEDICNL